MNTSIYSAVFEGIRPHDSDHFKSSMNIPQPYVVVNTDNPAGIVNVGEQITMELSLFGEAWRVLPILVPAIDRACEHLALGKGSGHIRLEDIDYRWINEMQKGWQELPSLNIQPINKNIFIPPCPDKINMKFVTPLRLIKKQKRIHPENFDWPFLLRGLIQRIANISYFHQNLDLHKNLDDIKQLLDSMIVESNLKNKRLKRFSNRQKKYVYLDGLMGDINVFFKPSHIELWPMIWLGQYTHCGKACVMGMGRYKISYF